MTIKQTLKEIEDARMVLKKHYPETWRVKVANAESITDMEVEITDSSCEMKWSLVFLENLHNQL